MNEFSFFDEPAEVVEYFKGKKPELHFDYDEIMHDTHKRVFTVAKITKIDLLNDIKNSLEEAFKNGKGFEQWKDELKPTLIKKGWFGQTTVTNPTTGEAKEMYVSSRRLKTIFDTNMRTSYAKARYESQMQSIGEYFRYTSVLDQKTRPAHSKLHGTILPKNDPFWNINYPPNGWRCRCKVQVLTDSEIKRRGLTPLADSSMLKSVAEKDFAYNPGETDNLDDVLKAKALRLGCDGGVKNLQDKTKLPCERIVELESKRELAVWQKSLDSAIDELLIKKNQKAPIEVFQIGKISPRIAKKAKEILNIDIKDAGIAWDKKGILHIRPERKDRYGQALSIDEIREIVHILNSTKTPISVDLENKNIIFWFDDKKDSNKINKIAIDLNYNLKKFGMINYVLTLGKVNKSNKNDGNLIEIR